MTIKISIDTRSGDHGLLVTIAAGIKALKLFDDLFLYFVGDKDTIQNKLNSTALSKELTGRYEIIHASEKIEMHDSVTKALRHKKDSSMSVSVKLVKNGLADACVSAGNTGALMAISRFILKTIPSISRPAIFKKLPTMSSSFTHMLDLGANVDSKPQNLLEFSTMGSIAVQYTQNIKKPTIGLLNIGEEDIKGNEIIKETSKLLKNSNLNYVGYVEGDDIYKGSVNLVVCDGFVGNISLKASEGLAKMVNFYLKKSYTKNIYSKIIGMFSKPILNDFKSILDPREYNGASFLGLQGIVIKSHGSADEYAFLKAIQEARLESYVNLPNKIMNTINIK